MKYREPSLTEGQRILALWQSVTSKPLTSREIEFYRAIVREMEWSKYFESPPSEIHEELISLRKDLQSYKDKT